MFIAFRPAKWRIDSLSFAGPATFVGNRTPMSLGRVTPLILNGWGVYFEHPPTGSVGQFLPFSVPILAIRDHRLDSHTQLPIVRSAEVQLLQSLQGLGMLRKWYFPIHEQVVREKVQPPRRRNRRIEHAHPPRPCASRLYETLSAT